jgi:hypothetical protein
MMAWSSLALVAIAGVSWGGDVWSRVHSDWHRNNIWPQPFIYADRAAVCEPFAIQINNGWRLQNTVGDAYFDPATQELSVAGQMKVKWIVTQSPANRRNVYVLISEDEAVTQARVASVQKAVDRYATKGPSQVFTTDRDIYGGSGEYYEAVDRALKSSVPVPRLPARGAGSAGGGAGAGAGAGGGAGGSSAGS